MFGGAAGCGGAAAVELGSATAAVAGAGLGAAALADGVGAALWEAGALGGG
jgi:hypothetical protein